MKRYFVITHQSEGNGHLNVQDLLPASCKLITGIAVNAIAKQDAMVEDVLGELSFPQALITDLLLDDKIADLFYSYLRTRTNQIDSRSFFESNILPEIVKVLSNNIVFPCLNTQQQQALNDSIIKLFNEQFTDYIYNEAGLFDKAQGMNDLDFTDFIAQQTLIFFYSHRKEIFKRTIQVYNQPQSYECGNISLLVNGNSFLLRDHMVTANRKVRHMSKEVIPFHEPLDVNSNVHTIFKSNKNSDTHLLTIRIYIQYETSK
ncbi:hypothetical protein [Carboxylicivirga sp. N1Y90]|uniref:hypothetical protein n=1 Tax=Carboxylicivirga fragile TaxID=3417571 RepID=UPI003D341A47|nr:hypothetical protein [Marinilabiliaceae bacterium N1Y90]